MNTFSFNFSDVPDSLRLSDVPYINKNKKGGFLGLFSEKGSKNDKVALKAASEKGIANVKFMVMEGLVDDYSIQDKDGNTILHYVVAAPEPDTELIATILRNPNVSKFINIQNNKGDTAIFVAARGGHHDICEMLQKAGADTKIKNNDGYHIDTESEAEHTGNKQVEKASNQDINKMMGSTNSMNVLFRKAQQDETYTDTFDQSNLPKNLELDKELIQVTEQKTKDLQSGGCGSCSPSCTCAQRGGCGTNCIPSCPCAQRGGCPMCNMRGGCGCAQRYAKSKTDTIITDIHKSFMNQLGGKKSGSRNLKRSDNSSDLARMLDNQASEIINRVIKKIQDIIADNKKEFKGLKSDETTARAIKSLIWSGLRKEYEGVKKSSLDIATEMENRVNLDYIKKYDKSDIENMTKTLKQHAEEKEKRKSQTTSDKKINMGKADSETSSSNL